MANKLSDALEALSVKTKSVANKIAAANAETKEKLDARIAESKAEAEAKKEHFIVKAESVKADVEDKNNSVKESINQKIVHLKADVTAKKEAVKSKVQEKKHEFNMDAAEVDYHDACTYAESCIEWAIIALAEVETAVLEAFAAKLKLVDLKNKTV